MAKRNTYFQNEVIEKKIDVKAAWQNFKICPALPEDIQPGRGADAGSSLHLTDFPAVIALYH